MSHLFTSPFCFSLLLHVLTVKNCFCANTTDTASSENWRPPDNATNLLHSRNSTSPKSLTKRNWLESFPSYTLRSSGFTTCVPIQEAVCRTPLYNYTYVPNEWGQATQADAAAEIKRLSWILRSRCSQLLPIFMCIFFFPVCTERKAKYPFSTGTFAEVSSRTPCAEMCQEIRNDCRGWLHRNGFNWPEAFSCDKLPPQDGEQECFIPTSKALALQSSQIAIRNMAIAKFVPPNIANHWSGHGKHDEVVVDTSHRKVDFENLESSHEIGLKEPAENTILVISISVLISMLVILSITIALVRCYFQVCTGSLCDKNLREARRRCQNKRRQLLASFRENTASKTKVATKDVSSPMHLTNLPLISSNVQRKSSWPRVDDTEEQSKTMSVYEVEDCALIPSAVVGYKYGAQYSAATLPSGRLKSSGQLKSSMVYDGETAMPQSLSVSNGLATRRPSVTWKRSTEDLGSDSGNLGKRPIVSSVSMTFDKSAESPNDRTAPDVEQQLMSKSQPELDTGTPVWQHRQGFRQRDVFERVPSIRRSKTVTTSSIGVGTSPSLFSRRPFISASTDGERLKFNQAVDAATDCNFNNFVGETTPVPASPYYTQRIGKVTSGEVATSNTTDNNKPTASTKYSITLLLDEASRVNYRANSSLSRPSRSVSSKETKHRATSPAKKMTRLNIGTVPSPNIRHTFETEADRKKQQAVRELFYV